MTPQELPDELTEARAAIESHLEAVHSFLGRIRSDMGLLRESEIQWLWVELADIRRAAVDAQMDLAPRKAA